AAVKQREKTGRPRREARGARRRRATRAREKGIAEAAICDNGSMARRTSKLLYVALYGAFASLGAALLARPAALFVHDLGLSGPVLPRSGPLGWPSAALLVVLGAFTVALAVS